MIDFALSPLRRATDWFALRTSRERFLLGSAVVVGAAALFTTGIWQPLAAIRAAAATRLDQQDTLIALMRSDAPRLRALSALAPTASALSASTAITQEAASRQITIQRLERDGARLRVVVDTVEFPALMAWLARLETAYGLRVAELELDRKPAPGIVSAHVTLEE